MRDRRRLSYLGFGLVAVAYLVLIQVGGLLIGRGEEGMFRGIGVTMLREHGLAEGRVALWSSLILGVVHLTNAVGRGFNAIPQAVAVSLAGYFFYSAAPYLRCSGRKGGESGSRVMSCAR